MQIMSNSEGSAVCHRDKLILADEWQPFCFVEILFAKVGLDSRYGKVRVAKQTLCGV